MSKIKEHLMDLEQKGEPSFVDTPDGANDNYPCYIGADLASNDGDWQTTVIIDKLGNKLGEEE